jgi:pimeloyl-ACP methyl ester carboxylesterase
MRLAVEHPEAVTKAAVLDIVPLPYSRVTREFATQYFHWFFLIQPAPFPETLIGNSAEFYLRSRFLRQDVGSEVFTRDRWREKAANVSGRSLAGGHFLPEEVPEQTLSALLEFLA